MLTKRNIDTFTSTDFIVDGIDMLAEFMANKTEKPDEKPQLKLELDLFPEPPVKKSKKKAIEPNYLVILDDLGTECRHPSVTQLLKTNRHYHAKILVSSQQVTDLDPASRRQLDYMLLLGGIPRDKLTLIYTIAEISTFNLTNL